jgi:hypothetical protein
MITRIVAIALLVVAGDAWGDTFSATDKDGKITLTTEPCTQAGPWFLKWKAAKWLWQGKDYEACWAIQSSSNGSQRILIIDSGGDVSNIDPLVFKKDEGV